jgi:hypothetical protein
LQNLAASRAQLELLNAAISRTNAAVASHLLSPAHGATIGQQQQQNASMPAHHHIGHAQQQQQANQASVTAKLATLQTLLMSLQQTHQVRDCQYLIIKNRKMHYNPDNLHTILLPVDIPQNFIFNNFMFFFNFKASEHLLGGRYFT